jgi:long-subunit acyl-CoA synthetase (AMP-forming)
MPRHTLVHQLEDWAARRPDHVALRQRRGDHVDSRTWTQFRRDVRALAKGLIALGHNAGDRVAIVGENRIEWVLAELAIMAAGGVPAPLYGTNTPEQNAFIVEDALGGQECRIAICDGRAQYDKYRSAIDEGAMRADWLVTMDDIAVDRPDVESFEALVARGASVDDATLEARIDALDPDETGLLIYTSGTTGRPKGVRLQHGAMVRVAEAIMSRLPAFGSGEIPYRAVSYLPLCHGAEQIVTTMGLLATGGEITFCADIKAIRDALVEVRPTMFLGVPRVWEKFEAALAARFEEATGVKRRLLDWARGVELDAVRRQSRTGTRHRSITRTLANRLALEKIRAAVGFDRVHFAVTGSAPISVGTLEFFASLGVVVNEAYGLSETTGVCTIGEPSRPRLGKVGTPLDSVELRIADDGEIQLRGPLMTPGYLNRPEETAALFSDDGWLCTGDLGSVDDDGFLSITGRKKELIITAGGKNVAPLEIEALLGRIEGIGQSIVVGDRRPYLSALLTIDPEAVPALAQRFGTGPTLESLAASSEFEAHVRDRIEADVNANLARVQTVKRFSILPREFSVEAGELTPTMKLRRDVISRLHAGTIEALYD